MVSLDAAEEAIELADAYGVCDGNPLSESQKITLRLAMGERADGSWAATRVGDFGPRQGTGKSDKIAVRELAGLILFGERLLIHTAHEFPTANECFLRLVAVFENWDDLRRKVARIRYANGEQGIELMSGQRLKYRARTGGSGRGFAKADLVVYDEAQHLQVEHVAASGPARLANPNSQSWYAGSGGLVSSVMAWSLRRAALAGTGGRLAYTEMTAEQLHMIDGKVESVRPDPQDRDAWYRAMPGLGRWVTEESMQALYEELGDEKFSREGLCVWDPPEDGESGVVPYVTWSELVDPHSVPTPNTVSYGLAAAPDGSAAAVGSAGCRPDGLLHVDTVKWAPGTSWVVPYVIDLYTRRRRPIRVNPAGSEGAFIRPLEEAGVEVVEVEGRDYQGACGEFLDAVKNRQVRHIDQQTMNRSVAVAGRRDVGKEGGWVWVRMGETDITPLVAATTALSGVTLSRKPTIW